MHGPRRGMTAVAVTLTSLATVAAGAGVWAVTASTDTAFHDRSVPVAGNDAAPADEHTVLGTQAVAPRSAAPRTTVAAKPAPKPVLAPGARGTKVRELQARLSQLAWFTPPMTGTYDRETRQGVRGFQAKRGLTA